MIALGACAFSCMESVGSAREEWAEVQCLSPPLTPATSTPVCSRCTASGRRTLGRGHRVRPVVVHPLASRRPSSKVTAARAVSLLAPPFFRRSAETWCVLRSAAFGALLTLTSGPAPPEPPFNQSILEAHGIKSVDVTRGDGPPGSEVLAGPASFHEMAVAQGAMRAPRAPSFAKYPPRRCQHALFPPTAPRATAS